MWAFNLTSDTIAPIERSFPQLEIEKKRALFGDIYQSALIVGTLLRIERFLGKNNYSRLHEGIVEGIDLSVRSRFVAAIQGLSSFLLTLPNGAIGPDVIPPFDSLHEKKEGELESLIGLWIAWSLIGRKPERDHELRFTSAVGRLAYGDNSKFIASGFLSDKKHITRYV